MFCTFCGAALDPGMRFCTECGQPVPDSGLPALALDPAPLGPAEPPAPAAPPGPVPLLVLSGPARFTFNGEGLNLFGLYLLTGLLGLVTAQIYTFWGRTEIRKWWYDHLLLDGRAFEWWGIGGELFIGFLKVIGIFIGITAIQFGLLAVRGEGVAQAVGALLTYGMIFLLAPFAVLGAARYRIARSRFAGLGFSLRTRLLDFYPLFLRDAFLTVITLGIYRPYFDNNVRDFIVNRAWYAGERFRFSGQPSELMRPYLWAYFLFLPTLGFSMVWYAARRAQYYWRHTSIGEATFELDIDPMEYVGIAFTNLLLIVFTLGIGLAWANIRSARFILDNLQLHGQLQVIDPLPTGDDAMASGEELADLLDLDIGFGL
jgi:uncharacterized membrane protein YjgN (DUF898 family)